MNDIDRKFLLAVERGDLSTLKTLLSSNDRCLNKNCSDPLARNALVIAIDNENIEIVKLLIEAKIQIGDALLYAIHENFVEAVELLLDYEESSFRTGNLRSWEQNRENSSFSPDLTPLILAAHSNNFEIIKIVLDRRLSPIPSPHDPRCDCNACCRARSDDCLKHSRSRINAYKALASPCLMALSSPDPLLTAFEMSAKLESLASMEPEYKNDYLKLRVQCQTFATKLLDHTRTSKELEILLNYSDEYLSDHDHAGDLHELYCQGSIHDMSVRAESSSLDYMPQLSDSSIYSEIYSSKSFLRGHDLHTATKKDSMLSLDSVTGRHESYKSHMRLARLRLAIQCKQKTFCAHPNIQELLATMWYEHLPGFRRKNTFAQTIQVILIGLMFPVYSIAYLVAPESQLGRYIKKPFIKFICHSASYITFLIVLILASQRVEAFYCWGSVIGLFTNGLSREQNSLKQILASEANFTFLKQANFDGADISTLAALYKQLGTSSGARGLDSLTKIFEQLPASAKKRGTIPSPIELVILIWVLSLIWAEIKQIRALGMNYYKADMWNTLDSVASGFYVGAIILRVVSYIQSDEISIEVPREHWHAYDPTLLSEALFAAATIFSSLKLVYIFSVNPYLGPLQISLGRMIIDILRFSWIYMLVLFSFACGMNQLLWYYADLERHQCLNITNYNLAQYYSAQHESISVNQLNSVTPSGAIKPRSTFEANVTTVAPSTPPPLINNGQNGSDEKLMEAAFRASLQDDSSKPPVTIDDSCKTWRHFSNVFESSQTLFWATFGLVDLENFDLTGIRQYTRFWALLMFGCYCFINVIVVLNLLIAMMNHSYVKISKKSDIEWKFARTRLWMSYFDTGSTVPAPFNIIPSIKSTFNLGLLISRQICRLVCRIGAFCSELVGSILGKTGCCRAKVSSTATAIAPELTTSTSLADFNSNNINNNLQGSSMRDQGILSFINGDTAGGCSKALQMASLEGRERSRRNFSLTVSYRSVMRSLVRRYLVHEQRLLERKRELTEAKLKRWAKLNVAFE